MALTLVLLLINIQNVRIIPGSSESLGRIYVYKESQAISALGDAINFLDPTTSMWEADKIEHVDWPFQLHGPLSLWLLWEDLQGAAPEVKPILGDIDGKIEENNVPAQALRAAQILRSVVQWCPFYKRKEIRRVKCIESFIDITN